MDDIYQLTEDDLSVMRELIVAHRNKRLPLRQLIDTHEHQAPEVYVVRVPTSGIAAASEGTLSGTGSSGLADDSFSSAFCQAYRLGVTGTPIVAGPSIRVYNPSKSAIAGDRWALVERDKWGKWYIPPSDLGALTSISFTVVTDCSFNAVTCVFTKVTSTITITGRGLSVVVS